MNTIKRILLNVFGDGFFGLERDQNTQEEITNGYREYQKKHKKPEHDNTVCYGIAYPHPSSCTSSCMGTVYVGGCASFSNTTGQNNSAIGSAFTESHLE